MQDRSIRWRACVCAAAWCFSGAARPADEPLLAAGDENLLFREVPVVIGASRHEQRVGDAPAAVTIVTREEIRRFGHRTLAEALASVQGFFVTNDRNYSYLGVRGFNRTGDYNSRVLMLVDGHRVNDNVYDQSLIGEDGVVEMDLVDRIEVIRGPSSSLYGTSAFFAVINVITRRGRDIGGEAVLEGGSLNTGRLRLTLGRQLDNGAELTLSASGFRSRGYDSLYYPEFDTAANNRGFARGADSEQAARLFGRYRDGDFSLSVAWVGRHKQIPTGSYSTIFNDNRAQTRDERLYINAQHRIRLDGAGDLRLRLAYDAMNYDAGYPLPGPPAVLNRDLSHGRWWSGEAVWQHAIAPGHQLTAGVEFRYNQRIDQLNYDAATLLDDRRRAGSQALFVQDEWRISPAVLLNAGLRYDRHQTFGGTVNPRLGLIHHASADTTLKFLYGTAYRAPNAYELYYTDNGTTQLANPNLRAERIRTYEAVWEHALSPVWAVNASLYRYRLTDMISQVTNAAGLLVFVNQGRVDATGIETGIEGSLWRGVNLKASIARQENRESVSGRILPNSPRTLGKFSATAPLFGDAAQLGVEAAYTGARDTLANSRLGPDWLVNLNLSSRRLVPGSTLSLRVKNLFNRRSFDPGGAEHTQDRIEQDRRSIMLRMEIGF